MARRPADTAAMKRIAELISASAIALALVALAIDDTQAHKPITSKYTYNRDVLPIFRDRCGRCHTAGGAAPMSLLSYKDALPWAESIREELIAERMPPWYVDAESALVRSSGGRPLTAHEIDTVITWATGGAPEGAPATQPEPDPAVGGWRMGAPDLVIRMDAEHTLPPASSEEVREFRLSTGLRETRWVKAADLLPGTPSMVRDATIAVENGAVLAEWVPGDEAVGAPAGTAFRLPAGAHLHLQIHYKKSWRDERIATSDRSAIGLYLVAAATPPSELQTMVIRPEASDVEPKEATRSAATVGTTVTRTATSAAADVETGGTIADAVTFARDVAQPLTIVGIRPALDRAYDLVDVHVRLPAGGRVPLLQLHSPRPEWARRYWLAHAIDVPAGSRIEASATPAPADASALSAAGNDTAATRAPLQLRLDVVFR